MTIRSDEAATRARIAMVKGVLLAKTMSPRTFLARRAAAQANLKKERIRAG